MTACVISGTPTVSGTFTPNLLITDSDGATVMSGALTLTISPSIVTLAVTTSNCISGVVNIPYAGCALTATGGTPPYTWDVASGSKIQ